MPLARRGPLESSYPYASKKSTGLFPYLTTAFLENLAHAMEMAAQAERLQIMQANLAKAYGTRITWQACSWKVTAK